MRFPTAERPCRALAPVGRLLVLATLILLSPARADAPPLAAATDLPALIRLAVARNPGVQAARQRWQATIAERPQATAWSDPVLRYDYFGQSVETRVGPQRHRFGISQPLPWPGARSRAGAVVDATVQQRRADYAARVRDLIVAVQLHYHELAYLRDARSLTAEHEKLLAQVLGASTAAYARGEAKLADPLRAQSQLAQLQYDQVLLRELAEVERGKLLALLDLPGDTQVGPLAPVPARPSVAPLPVLEEAALAGRQELTAAQARVSAADARVALRELQQRPQLSVHASWIETGDAAGPSVVDSGADPWLVGVGISIPLDWSGRRAAVRQARLERELAQQEHRTLANETRSAIRETYFRRQNAERLARLYAETLLPQAEKALESVQPTARQDTQDYAGWLELQATWLNFQLARRRALADAAKARAQLERLVGGTLPTAEAKP